MLQLLSISRLRHRQRISQRALQSPLRLASSGVQSLILRKRALLALHYRSVGYICKIIISVKSVSYKFAKLKLVHCMSFERKIAKSTKICIGQEVKQKTLSISEIVFVVSLHLPAGSLPSSSEGSYLGNGQWLWLTWQSGHFRLQRSATRIQSSAQYILSVY